MSVSKYVQCGFDKFTYNCNESNLKDNLYKSVAARILGNQALAK